MPSNSPGEGKAGHTPTPWQYGKASNYDGWYIAPQGLLPTLAAVHNFPGQTEANAVLIVRAVNAHEAMREALKDILRIARAATMHSGGDVNRRRIAKAEAALALAEGEPSR